MKPLILLVAILATLSANSQDIFFKINQFGISRKDAKGIFRDAVIEDRDLLIVIQNKRVQFTDEKTSDLILEKEDDYRKLKNTLSQSWQGHDHKKKTVQFKFTLNHESNEAVVELAYKDYRNYYFGSCGHNKTTAAK
jgi:hypothetical protein